MATSFKMSHVCTATLSAPNAAAGLHLNQIPQDYTVEMTNRFRGLDLIDTVPGELCTEIRDIVQEVMIKTTPRKRNAKRQKGCLKRPYTEL